MINTVTYPTTWVSSFCDCLLFAVNCFCMLCLSGTKDVSILTQKAGPPCRAPDDVKQSGRASTFRLDTYEMYTSVNI